MPTTKRRQCDSCQLLRINGAVCHEIGCPNAWKDKRLECKWCGRYFRPRQRASQVTCSGGCARAYHGP
jgi:hypothetical protein